VRNDGEAGIGISRSALSTLASNIDVVHSSDMSKYRDVADDLRRLIADGQFPVGSQLPGITALQRRYNASLGTVRAAQEILRDEGLLRTAQGEGSFVLAVPDPDPVDVLDKLRLAQAAITAAIEALEKAATPPRAEGG
jgi:DNA-binding GntR family transcriptional regulator